MSTKAYYPINEIGAGKPGFSKTRSIIEAAFYGNNVVKVNTVREAYELAKNSPGTIVTDMPVYRAEEQGLEAGSDEYKQAVIDAIAGGTIEGITGTFTFDEHHNPIKSTAILTYVDGKPELKEMF